MNGVEKVVVSTTLSGELEWNNSHLLQGDLASGIAALKARKGKDITVHGSAALARSLVSAGLVDEIHLIVFPIVVGEGPRLFEDGVAAKWNLTALKQFASGAIALCYEPFRE
jgi:dihydrofolate reductase